MFDWQSGHCSHTGDESEEDLRDDGYCSQPKLCHPELMSKHELQHVLHKKHLSLAKEDVLNGYEYSNMIELYNKVILPLPQRQYSDNRMGCRLKNKQIDCNKNFKNKRKCEEITNHEINSKKLKINNNNYIANNNTNHQTIDLKQSLPQSSDNQKRQKISWP
ncbi:uncharacterized protein LOC128960969 [Oppia nitens]|uniref:uncharacterized protein LOC128960969 n=1 Tax=Oppia nitens TaxID=1686743 RepID=UPI0023DA0685|nr:uncharacterized protein LOC128960969 [Oppia nitens]